MDVISSRLMVLTGAFVHNGNGGSGSVIKLGSSRLIDMDNPPNSRIFIVCSKNHTESELKYAFEKFGDMEDIWLVKDKNTKESKGVAYIKYARASQAMMAVEEMHGKQVGPEPKPLKVMVAQSRSSGSTNDISIDAESLTRLFLVIPKSLEEEDLKDIFKEWGPIEYVNVVRDRGSGDPKGFGYVKYYKASHAALALENCDKTYKPVFAEPRVSRAARESPSSGSSYNEPFMYGGGPPHPSHNMGSNSHREMPRSPPLVPPTPQANDVTVLGVNQWLYIIVDSSVSEHQLHALFDLIPGLEFVDLQKDRSTGQSRGCAYARYTTAASAIYAREKLNGFEYPPGIKLVVKYADSPHSNGAPGVAGPSPTPAVLAPAPPSPILQGMPINPHLPVPGFAGFNRLQQYTPGYCTAQLPGPQPLADPSSDVAERLFIVCTPTAPPEYALKDVFSRFGKLIDVYLMRDKNYGYAKYAQKVNAEAAIESLHGQEICGQRLKVMLADPPKQDQSRKRPRTSS
ncbi:RNA-binding protein 45-like isoform X2 [Branchiostoma lanceolatum]|uniref:RNA-binding protein 45-like isoform X2 n=1 Tax=Branchiostoma lanceolatum TaxID=7740 RepID=UPI0034571273